MNTTVGWADLIEDLRQRQGMYTLRPTFEEACALLVGFGIGMSDDLLDRFHDWLIATGPSTNAGYAWPTLVLERCWPNGDLPMPGEMSAVENEAARNALFALLGDFVGKDGGE